MSLLTKIKELCKLNNITLTQLEKDLGFSNMSIRKWEFTNPSFDKVIKVANYFNVTTDYLADINHELNSVSFNDPILIKIQEFRSLGSETGNKKLDKIILSCINIEMENK